MLDNQNIKFKGITEIKYNNVYDLYKAETVLVIYNRHDWSTYHFQIFLEFTFKK